MSPGEHWDDLPSWQTYRDLLDRAERHQAWSEVAHWAIDVLSEVLGDQWPRVAYASQKRKRRAFPLLSALAALGGSTLALTETIEWAARLRLIENVDGNADVRRDLIGDVTEGRIHHTDLQLQTAGLVAYHGWEFRLEPTLPGAERPADLLIKNPRCDLTAETRVLTEAEADRASRNWLDQAVDRLTILAAAHRVWLEGHLGDGLDEATVRELERRIPVEALAARVGYRPELSVGAAHVRLVRQEGATGRLTAPGPSSDLWPRMARTIAEKAKQMKGSGESGSLQWPRRGGLIWTHLASVVVGRDVA